MKPFTYVPETTIDGAARVAGSSPRAEFLAGGTTLVDLMKLDVLTPDVLVGVNRLPLGEIELKPDGIYVGATVTNTQLACHPEICERYPALSEALLSGASAQLRNMATVAGNIMQRTRCPYYREVHAACNRREPGRGCDAIAGLNRGHAVLGASDQCIAVHPSDMCVALVIYDAMVHTERPDGTRRVLPLADVHCVPGDTPERESVLDHGELITHVVLPLLAWSKQSHYLKVRDRASYEFALTSAAVGFAMEGDRISLARIGLGGVATKPWRARIAEALLVGQQATPEVFARAAAEALRDAVARRDNGFKIELARRTIIRAFAELHAHSHGAQS